MLAVKDRSQLEALAGKQRPRPPSSSPAPSPDALKNLQASVDQLAQHVSQAIATHTPPPTPSRKQMEAVVHRDSQGRMEKVTITVKEEQ